MMKPDNVKLQWVGVSVVVVAIVLFCYALVFGATPVTPIMTYDATKKPPFLVTFEKGFIWTCTEYKSLTETIEQEGKVVPYTPRSCGPLRETQTSYVETWDFVEPNGGLWEVRAVLQTEDATEYPSNVVTVKH